MMETGLQVARQLDEDWLNQLLAQLRIWKVSEWRRRSPGFKRGGT
jgi:hypothetical protein